MWDSKSIERGDNGLHVSYQFSVPLEMGCEDTTPSDSFPSIKSGFSGQTVSSFTPSGKPNRTDLMNDRFFRDLKESTESAGSSVTSWKEDRPKGRFDQVVTNIRSFNQKIAQKFGFNLREYHTISSSSSNETLPHSDLPEQDASVTFGSTQWEESSASSDVEVA